MTNKLRGLAEVEAISENFKGFHTALEAWLDSQGIDDGMRCQLLAMSIGMFLRPLCKNNLRDPATGISLLTQLIILYTVNDL